jgi:thiosulfate/3-mercaptopyruvate sulfurtransferase
MTRSASTMVLRPNVKRIDVSGACNLMLRSDTLVFDVRDRASYEREHIPAARHACDANMFEILTSYAKGRPVLIYCYHGNASQTVARTFIDFGFRDVYSLDGGFELWRQGMARTHGKPRAGGTQGS